MRKYNPCDALKLMRSREVVEYACDVVRNPAFSRASATTLDAHGLRIADYVATRGSRERWPEQLLELLTLPLPEFERAMAQEPVRLSRVPKADGRMRDIAVPSFLRRCVSNALNDVLTATGDHLLPRSVRAYRPGSTRAVQDAILDVAEAVHDGRVRYFAKLDIESYFTQMAWPSIEAALTHYGYDGEFIKRVLVAIKCPVVRRDHGRLIHLAMNRGAQMGLAESATVANMLPWDLDLELERRGPGLAYIRYSDDLFLGSARHGEVVSAVRLVAAWCRAQGLRLKGLDRNARLAGVVRDIKKAKIELLGSAIDALGYVHMPPAKIGKKIAELDHMHARLAVDRVHGVSRYGNGGGVEAFDEQDLHQSMTAFVDYWSPLDPRGAERAHQTFNKRFPVTAASSDAARGTVWAARLWGARTNREGGTAPTVLHPILSSSERSSPAPDRTSPAATGEMAGEALRCAPSSLGGALHSGNVTTVPGPASDAPPVAPATGNLEAAAHVKAFTCVERSTSWEGGTSDRWDEEALPSDADGHETHRFDTRSVVVDGSWLGDLDEDHLAAELHHDRAQGDPTDGASPPQSVFENATYIHAARARVGRDQAVLVGTCRVAANGFVQDTAVHVARERRVEAAVVRAMLDHLGSSADRRVVFGMEQTWLCKGLLQPRRRFRAPLLFTMLLDLHELARGRVVQVVGGVEVPRGLQQAMERLLDRLVRAAA